MSQRGESPFVITFVTSSSLAATFYPGPGIARKENMPLPKCLVPGFRKPITLLPN